MTNTQCKATTPSRDGRFLCACGSISGPGGSCCETGITIAQGGGRKRLTCPACILDHLVGNARPDSEEARVELHARLTSILGETLEHDRFCGRHPQDIADFEELCRTFGC